MKYTANKNLTTDLARSLERSITSLVDSAVSEAVSNIQPDPLDNRNLATGIKAIRALFHCGQNKAQELKDGILAPAIYQEGPGCKIYIDVPKALKLYKEAYSSIYNKRK